MSPASPAVNGAGDNSPPAEPIGPSQPLLRRIRCARDLLEALPTAAVVSRVSVIYLAALLRPAPENRSFAPPHLLAMSDHYERLRRGLADAPEEGC